MIKVLKRTKTKSGNILQLVVQYTYFVRFMDKKKVIGIPLTTSDKMTASKHYTQIKNVRGA